MRYVQYVNELLKEQVNIKQKIILFGQNIDAGSCLGGLTRGLASTNSGITVINTPNSENCLVGVGFGLMMNNISSVFFMKQLDFLLLGIDQIVNTYNVIRQTNPSSSFTIFPVTMDSGYEGPQASLNNLDDFCSIAGINGYSITNNIDAKEIISRKLIKPGFRIISVGQRLLQDDVLELECLEQDMDDNFFKYKQGEDATIVCFNNSLQYGLELHDLIKLSGKTASLFSINAHSYKDYSSIIDDISKTQNLVLIDDTKSRNTLSDQFIIQVLSACKLKNKVIIKRPITKDMFYPRKDLLVIDYNAIVYDIFRS